MCDLFVITVTKGLKIFIVPLFIVIFISMGYQVLSGGLSGPQTW